MSMTRPEQMAASGDAGWRLAWRMARREIRGSVARFRVFLGALMLGVAAIGTVGSVAEAMRSGIAGNAQLLLGGDIELRSLYVPTPADMTTLAKSYGRLSASLEMRAMLQAGDERKLVALKAVDPAWPLVGAAELGSGGQLAAALADGSIVVDPQMARALELGPGTRVRIGDAELTVADTLGYEPDRSVSFVTFGPRVLMSTATLEATGLNRPGAMITHRTRLLLDRQEDRVAAVSALRGLAETNGVRVRDLMDAAPGFDVFIDRTEVFLVLVGLTALLIGGLGVAGAVRAWLGSRMPVIATFKCLGAPARLVFRIYLIQVMMIASLGVGLGVLVAAVAPVFAVDMLSSYVTVPIAVSVYPLPLLVAAGFGLVTSFLFALWPLAKAEEVRAATLFRRLNSIPGGRPKPEYLAAALAALVGLAALAFVATRDLRLTLTFIAGSLAAIGLLAALGQFLLVVMRRLPAPSYVPARLALSAITRPGSPVRSVVIAFGLGLSVLVTVSLSQANIGRQIDTRVAEDAPAWFFIDIQPDQIDRFMDITTGTPGVTEVSKTPMLRGRVTSLGGRDAAEFDMNGGSAWVLRGDRALTWSATPPESGEIVAGDWWPADYAGTPRVSMSEEEARELGVWIGDSVTFNVLGRSVTAEITNIRSVDWESFSINFVFVLSPGLLEVAPHSWMASARVDSDDAAIAVDRRVAAAFSNVSTISVREAVATAQRVIGLLGAAVQMTALVTLVAGIAVLAGTVASTEAQRLADSVILKVLGATRVSIAIAWFLEYALLGMLAAIAAAIIGSIASWGLIEGFLKSDFELDFMLVLLTTMIGAATTAMLGLAGAVRTLGRKPAPLLREV
ncbi:MAG: FtsX-like permease family protein [Pseudomonadota bacterium]|nr:FtsX-like permease family protein [Pseudomonadota bacterium]MEC8268780.1 FtsX-like permease family protein [Pseudomonadota bacterium]